MNSLSTLDLSIILKPYKESVESSIRENIKGMGQQTPLVDACEYALLNGGKRFRPALVLMIADALGYRDSVLEAALAIEYFHTASLIADDLPCMDDDEERRNRPSVHKVYGETIALLASYGLIAEGYQAIANNGETIRKANLPFSANSDHISILALKNATLNTGLLGATGGQFLDMYPPDFSLQTIREMIKKKTVSLFEVAFVFGWLFAGGHPQLLDLVKQAAFHFGMAFQIADDLEDIAQDTARQCQVNIAMILGFEGAKKMFHEEIEAFRQVFIELKLLTPPFVQIIDLLHYQIESLSS
jgi:geranylgeranyl diphosphate synthase type II